MPIMTDIDRIIATARRDSRFVSGAETRALCDEIERLQRERDWARHAAGCLFRELQDGMSRWKASDFLTRHPWLSEAAKAGGGE